MASIQGPIVPRRRLAIELGRLRDEAGKTLDEVAHDLLISTSKLSRLENAQGSPQARDVRDLAIYYGVSGTPLGDRLMRWAAAGRRQGWWSGYPEVLHRDPGTDAYLAYETEATEARVYTIPYITGLLQTAEYTTALITSMDPSRTPTEVDRFTQVRALRQKALHERESLAPLELKAVLHEACLTSLVGTPSIMADQLDALLKATDSPNIDIRILRSAEKPHRMNTCTWSYFMFEDSLDRDVVQVETHAGFLQIETGDQVKAYDRAFTELTRRAVGNSDSLELIDAARNRWRT